jgi:hypothetical protein
MDKAPDNKALANSDIPFPYESEIGRRLTMGDICHYAPGMLNKIGKEGKTSWDSFAYALMMAHNVYCHIVAVQRANQLVDVEFARINPNWRYWGIEGKKERQFSDWVPYKILYFNNFVEELFNTKNLNEAFELIDAASPFLRSLEGARLQGGPVVHGNKELFDWGESRPVKSKDGDYLFDQHDDDKTRKLEEGTMEE